MTSDDADSRGFKYSITEILLKLTHLTDFSLEKTLTQSHRIPQQKPMSDAVFYGLQE